MYSAAAAYLFGQRKTTTTSRKGKERAVIVSDGEDDVNMDVSD